MKIEKGRVGQFFLFLGLLLLIIFFTTGQSQTPPPSFFFAGVICASAGIYLIRKDWKPAPPSGRFRLLRKPVRKDEETGKQ